MGGLEPVPPVSIKTLAQGRELEMEFIYIYIQQHITNSISLKSGCTIWACYGFSKFLMLKYIFITLFLDDIRIARKESSHENKITA